ncbi:MAG: shikimate dehydrogenase [Rhodospirillaceae bacterium]|jgi:shikimate dehydrogenase|nr:shikimate dehydrogenase [Rhodospirillaceae bacterium]
MSISGSAKLAGVLGWPVSHTLSPRLHGYWLEHYDIDGAYVPLPVRPENFSNAVRALGDLGFRGANVTVPHKETAFAAMDDVSDMAKTLRAINTIVIADDGTMFGDNTDGYGFMESLRAGAAGIELQDQPVVVLGAGGASRAIVAALLTDGAGEVRVFNRTLERAEALAKDIGGAVRPEPMSALAGAIADAALLVNTTSLGMIGHAPLEIDISALPSDAVVADIVYSPLETDLLKQARTQGHRVVDGLGMLLHQARPAFAAWFGIDPEVTPELRAAALVNQNVQ